MLPMQGQRHKAAGSPEPQLETQTLRNSPGRLVQKFLVAFHKAR